MTAPTARRLVLGSASPARLAVLRAAGLDPEVVVSGVDESDPGTSEPAGVADELARRKAAAVAARVAAVRPGPGTAPALVLGCDSVLDLDGRALGKPRDAAEAVERWRAMRGREGVLRTGHCLVDLATDRRAEGVASTLVRFADVDDDEVAAYVATGEPLHVAGAFTVDGLGGAFVEGVDGDHHNVVGVSLPLLRRLVRGLDLRWTDLWAARRTAPH